MHSLQNRGYPHNPLPVRLRNVCNPLPYDDVVSQININHGNQRNQISINGQSPYNGQPPASEYETLNRETQEMPLERNYSSIADRKDPGLNYSAITRDGNPGRKLPEPISDQQAESDTGPDSIRTVTLLKEDQDGYLAPDVSHTYFVLDKQNDS